MTPTIRDDDGPDGVENYTEIYTSPYVTTPRPLQRGMVARCPEHGLHGSRKSCFVCGGPVEQVLMVEVPIGDHDDKEEGMGTEPYPPPLGHHGWIALIASVLTIAAIVVAELDDQWAGLPVAVIAVLAGMAIANWANDE